MTVTSSRSFKPAYIAGLLLNIISFGVYLFSWNASNSREGLFSQTFFINYVLTVIYLIILLTYKFKFARPRPNISYGCLINMVVLFTISAFSLNKEMAIFSTFPQWLNISTLLMVGLFFIYPYMNKLPVFMRVLVYVFTGYALLLASYMALYLIVLIPITVISFWFFGISLHSLVPALWLLVIINFLRRSDSSKFKKLVLVGLLVPMLFMGMYVKKWYDIQTQVKDIIAQKNRQLSHGLPDAVQLAQKLPSDPMTDEILLSPIKSQRFWDDGFGINNMEQSKFHDPLSVISISLFGDIDIDYNTVETILNIRKDYRHKTTRRLWTGMSLSTSAVSTNIRVFPEYRLAYHEKTIVIHNDPDRNTRNVWFVNNTQEAVYTFHVPEGSIVTSLSLWVNGKERKSRLSTVQKADSAYTTIVGVERRDPAMVHWQEGNTVVVNVFPCTKEEDRTFKIGFTTPLSIKNGELCLENIWFEGPDFNSAREATSIAFGAQSGNFKEIPESYKKDAKGEYIYKGDYIPDWKMKMDVVPLATNKFNFNGFEYSLKEMTIKQKLMTIEKIYLDITKEWSRDEYDKVLSAAGKIPVYTWLPEKVEIVADNKDLVWEEVSRNQFSMPFLYDITNPAKALVVTKCGPTSPLLSDLKGTDYSDKTTAYLLETDSKLAVANIGDALSPLWRSLHELRLIDYNSGTLNDIIRIMETKKFNSKEEDSTLVSLSESHIGIHKKRIADTLKGGDAPDHLLRLFAYNDILRKVGKKYFEKEKYETELLREAEEGYIVTPVTSMLVLETDDDYKKMGIDENKNTLGNAGIVSGGAVPEPHEWLLIGLVFILILKHLYSKHKLQFGSYFNK